MLSRRCENALGSVIRWASWVRSEAAVPVQHSVIAVAVAASPVHGRRLKESLRLEKGVPG